MAEYDLPTRVVRHLPTGTRMIINACDFDAATQEDWTDEPLSDRSDAMVAPDVGVDETPAAAPRKAKKAR